MQYDEIIEKFKLDDICPEIDNEINGQLIDLIGDSFESGIFPEPSTKNDNFFVITLEINECETELIEDDIVKLKSLVLERLIHNFGADWTKLKKFFDGIQIFINGEQV